jgi:hypothetical protein
MKKIKQLFLTTIILVLFYSIAAYCHIVSNNRFCAKNSLGIPLARLVDDIKNMSALTNVTFHKGYIKEETWIPPWFDFSSRLAPDFFSCTISVQAIDGNFDNTVTVGYSSVSAIGYSPFKTPLN